MAKIYVSSYKFLGGDMYKIGSLLKNPKHPGIWRVIGVYHTCIEIENNEGSRIYGIAFEHVGPRLDWEVVAS